ncbi:TetR family transcriptional regulator C-terminal domain-containing protein [Flavobacterium silvaticum]|uniref:TetR/AcrR family transcriptional regulator n=1 Tax=Flavobacterium silvaticum TaxID=1852020 RepID=A0A972JGV1_9FLAO|nr:TetR family transcriptional regulator C-terminal domain-containing protein [Flavobacterium silvaticum]NMH29429.1 TetR/AcrR family transcriptional regulator [Flavobacterium silvaticum]
MAVKKNVAGTKAPITETTIIGWYVQSVLENNGTPQNVYSFCKQNGIEETDFYKIFGSFDALKQSVWNAFLNNATQAMQNEPSYATYTPKNKLLSLYFTLFEILTLNRSYILYSLKDNGEGLKNLQDLKQFRRQFKDFVTTLVQNASPVSERIQKIKEPVYAEGAWVQFLFILKFWIDDNSPGFEKTDIVIEKSVNTVVDLFDTKPLENLFDLGKFLWKEAKMR